MPPISRFLPLLLVALAVSPLEAQKAPKRDRAKIMAEELAEYGLQPISDVLPKARPHFLQFNMGSSQGMGEATMAGMAPGLTIYIGQQPQGDSATLRFYRADQVKEVRFYKPNEAMSRLGANNTYVIQLILKDVAKQD